MCSSANINNFIEEFLNITQQKRDINLLNTQYLINLNIHVVQLNQTASAKE